MTLAVSLLMILPCSGQGVDDLKLKDYRPKSIYNIPITNVSMAKYPAIDMHTQVYGRNDQEIARWIKAMDACGIEKAVVLTVATGVRFDTLVKMYSKYDDRFECTGLRSGYLKLPMSIFMKPACSDITGLFMASI